MWSSCSPLKWAGATCAATATLADASQSKNLAAKHLDVVKKLSANVEAWIAMLPKEYEKTKDQT